MKVHFIICEIDCAYRPDFDKCKVKMKQIGIYDRERCVIVFEFSSEESALEALIYDDTHRECVIIKVYKK